jgi:AraC-like DNA-binding protein
MGDHARSWHCVALPPLPELMVHAELCQACVDGESDVAVDEAALLFLSRFLQLSADRAPEPVDTRPLLRRRVIDSALWIDENFAADLDLASVARQAGLSPFHFLRTFARVLGVTPHQYLVRCRLRHAARQLGSGDASITDVAFAVGFRDLSNFVRTFRRAAGVSPRGFQVLAGRRPKRGSGREVRP